MQRPKTSFLFDLDGTLVDSVYQHVLSWREALEAEGIQLSVWRIHRKIGMSGGLLTNMLLREIGIEIDSERIEHLRRLHAAAYSRRSADIRPLPGARELLMAARRAPALGIGLLSGGYGQEELERAGAYRVYEDPADLLKHIDEVGGPHMNVVWPREI
jgi:phosphoglycolate phosphatase-like HAD superfamily hydrolase